MNYPETVTEFLTHVNGKVYSVCEVFYTIYLKDCTKPQEAAEQLRTFLENCLAIPSDYTLMVEGKYSEEEVGKTIGEIKPILTQLVQNLMDKSPAEDQFYLELWTQMCNKTLFPNELTKEKTVFIAQILGYYQGQIKQLMDSQKKEKSPNARQDDSGTE